MLAHEIKLDVIRGAVSAISSMWGAETTREIAESIAHRILCSRSPPQEWLEFASELKHGVFDVLIGELATDG